MRVVVVYKNQNDYTSTVDEFLHDFEYQTGHKLEVVDPESLQGIGFCETYDVVEYPSIIAISDNGAQQKLWRGLPLPTISDVSFYVQ
jgi:hypothetical protein